jgi:hypothetical protein
MIEPILSDLEESLTVHDRTVKIGFMIYELLSTAGYDDDEIVEVGSAILDIVG